MFEPAHFRHAAFGATWGRALTAVGDLDRADRVLTTAYRTWRKSRPADHPDLVNTLTGLGVVQRLQGRLGPSERTLREAHAIAVRYPNLKERGADIAGELGLTLRARGQTDEAEGLLRQSYDTLLEIFGAAHPLTQKAKARVDGATR